MGAACGAVVNQGLPLSCVGCPLAPCTHPHALLIVSLGSYPSHAQGCAEGQLRC